MKHTIHSLFLTALFGLFGMVAWAQTTYEISSANDLLSFAEKVNGDEPSANAVLTADIDMADMVEMDGWTPIGSSKAYVGHFDGQGHSITGFNVTSSQEYYGLFGTLSTGALVENFSIYGVITNTKEKNVQNCGVVGYAKDTNPTIRNVHSYLTINNARPGARLGGILGSTNTGTVIVENCAYSGTLDGCDEGGSGNYGGIVGYIQNNGTSYLQITNCLFDGQLINTAEAPGGCTVGGMIGYVGAGPNVKIKNCLSIGTVQSKVTGQFYGAVKNANCTIEGSFYQGDNINGSASTVTPKVQEATAVTDEQLASGEVCFKLNGDQTAINWFQTLSEDIQPMLDATHRQVYLIGRLHCNGDVYEDVTYSNQKSESIQDDHNAVDGFCTYCGLLDENYMTANEEGFYEIGTANQLKWFAANVNQINPAANAVLTGDIDLNGVAMQSIGTSTAAYTGQFDGQGHKIMGFEMTTAGRGGLFGDVTDATICNFSISGKLTVTGGTGSGLIAWATSSTISNVHSILDIDVPVGEVHHVGGVVGSARGNNIIKGCSFAGTMTVAAGSTDNFSGVVSYLAGDDVINCANYGTVSFAGTGCSVGGVVGYLNNKNSNIKYCLNIGKVEFSGEGTPKFGGAIVGRIKSNWDANKVTDNYWLKGSAYGPARKDDGSSPLAASEEGSTAEQMASGEIAARLAPYFRQNIGADETPVLDATHNIVAEITEVGYSTLYITDTDVTIPAGVKAYTGEVVETSLKLRALEDAIAAGEPVVLKGTAGYYGFAPTEGVEKVEKNDLKGAAEDIDATGKYVLAKPEGEAVGFYKAESGSIKRGEAYLENESDEKAFYLTGDNPTGISVLTNASSKNEHIYNLAGQRMSKAPNGISIVNGRKVVLNMR